MIKTKVSSHTNFSGIKYSNNPLMADPNSFSNAENVYLNKYNALISRPPIVTQDYPYQAYSVTEVSGGHPINLKLVGLYNLSNDGVVYIIFDTTNSIYTLRYKSPAIPVVYSDVIAAGTLTAYTDFMMVQYKQYYIMFTKNGTRVLETSVLTNSWAALSTYVDIPVTIIQTGNERLELDGNELTGSYKEQYVVKPDSDDTIYALPDAETATVVFPSQTDTTYTMLKANEYTRDRLLRKLNTPANYDAAAIISMAGSIIAIAHSDRVDISLDYGETFETIVYPTTTSTKYKNTASLSDDGTAFFYVHSDGVYRYMIGAITTPWELIKVVVDFTYSVTLANPPYESLAIERQVRGFLIDTTAKGANYCHFVNAEKFAFMLAYYRTVTADWISVLYTKGLNMTNLFDQDLAREDASIINSFATVNNGTSDIPINIIGANTDLWSANPYLNARLVHVIDNDTVGFYSKQITATFTTVGIFLKATPTHIYRAVGANMANHSIAYVAAANHSITTTTVVGAHEINDLLVITNNIIKVLVKDGTTTNWKKVTIAFTSTAGIDGAYAIYTIVFTLTLAQLTGLYGVEGATSNPNIIHMLSSKKYLGNGRLITVDDSVEGGHTAIIGGTYILPYTSTIKVVISGPNYLVYDETTGWYTNMPLLATLTYTHIIAGEFTQVPAAVFNDQNLWLAMDKTLWIGSLIDDKLSVLAINHNKFSKQITAICPISATSKAIFFSDSITLCEEMSLSDGSPVWNYYPLKFAVGVRQGDDVITTNDGKFTIFSTKYGLAVLTYQLDIAATEQAITYITDDVKTLWSEFYNASTKINILHHNTQLILSNGTNQVLIYDFRTNGWYPLTFPIAIKISRIQGSATNYEILELQSGNATITTLTGVYTINKEQDELYAYATLYKDFGTVVIPWHLTSQLLLLAAPNNYKNISQLIIDQIDSDIDKQSAYLTTQLFRQRSNVVKPSLELIYNIDTFAKIVKKVNWWKVLGLKWQLENDAGSSYPTQLRLYNLSITYDVSYEVK